MTESLVPGDPDPSGGWDPPEAEAAPADPGTSAPPAPYRVPGTSPAPRRDGWFSSSAAGAAAAAATARASAVGMAPGATPGMAPGATPGATPSATGKAGFFSDLPFRAPADISGWVVAGGSALAAVAFLLPWAQVGVAGTRLDPDYFGRWGLANPSYLLLMAAAVVTFLIVTIPNRLPAVVGSIALPILLGGIFLGLGWSYLTGPYGTGAGVDAMSIGALLMAAGGMLELRPGRISVLAGVVREPDSGGTQSPTP